MSDFIYQTIKLTNLLVNTENYRFDPVGSQIEAIQVMVRNQNIKLYNLAQDIVTNGLNPADLLVVSPLKNNNNLFVVHEGNRRITTLKILFQPDLIPQELKSLQTKFRELNAKNDLTRFEELYCVVYENYEQPDHWIEIKHTGELEGVGTVRWDTKQQERFKANTGGVKSTTLQVIDFVEKSEYFDSSIKISIHTIGVTNLDRLINDPHVRSFLGLVIEKNQLKLGKPEWEVAKGLAKIISDLSSKKIIVNDIYYKQDRLRYLESFEDDEIPQNFSDEVEDEISQDNDFYKPRTIQSNPNRTAQGNKAYGHGTSNGQKDDDIGNNSKQNKDSNKATTNAGRNTTSRPIKRKAIIPSDFIVRPKDNRINLIYRELKRLDADDFTNSASVMLRVFLEMSIDYYLSHNPIVGVDNTKSLKKKMEAVADVLERRKSLSRKELQPIRIMVSTSSVYSTETLNAYVHNRLLHPNATELKNTWDNVSYFIKILLAN